MIQEPTPEARRVLSDDRRGKAPNPKRHFASPELLLDDASLADAEKIALLREWNLEIDNRLKAEDEGMSVSDPIGIKREARLADEERRVSDALSELAARAARKGQPPPVRGSER